MGPKSKSKKGSSAAAAFSLRDVTNEVTKEKLAWLENQRKVLKEHYATILEKYEKPENKASLKFLKEIHETLKKCPEGENPAPATTEDLKVLLNWIDPENEDAGVYFGTNELVKDWILQLITFIKNQIEKCEYSCMYANAMTQYMDSKSDQAQMPDLEGDVSGEKLQSQSANGEDKNETIAEFNKRVFSASAPEHFEKEAFDKLLQEKLFDQNSSKEKKQLLKLRQDTAAMCKNMADDNHKMTTDELKLCISGLVQEGSLGPVKTATLKELRENQDALTEVCTLLNKRIKKYDTWAWPEPVVVKFQRNIAGRYRAYMEEDLLTAILLHFIGAKWSIYFKTMYKSIYESEMWKRGTGTIGDMYYMNGSIQSVRRNFHSKSFLSVLPDSMQDLVSVSAIYDDEKSDQFTSSGRKSELTPMKIKQQLLHIISNEIHLNNALRPNEPLTIVQTDMEWFGPSLIHDVVLSVLEYFGVTEKWLNFFRNFLKAPLKIESADAPIQIRQRGAPISHLLTTLFGESLLFVMDLYVNRESELSIYRIHDDFWFWSHRNENVTKAWTAMQTFTKLAGLSLNEEKSASILCESSSGPSPIRFGPEPLPQRHVQWGFIVLHSDGIFRISDEKLAPHVTEMKEYLNKSDSVMNWVHGHNRYIRFFIRNFGESAKTFGKQHIVQIMEKLKDILKQVHPVTNGHAAEALKIKFPEIFKGNDVMDAWVYWPVRSGGLALFNPFLDLIPLYESYRRQDETQEKLGYENTHFGKLISTEEMGWDGLLEKSKERRKKRAQFIPHTESELEEETISDEEVYKDLHNEKLKSQNNVLKRTKRVDLKTRSLRYRETKWSFWGNHYSSLLTDLSPTGTSRNANWREYMYEDQIEGKLGHGETEFVDGNLVPLSLITAMQSERVHNN